MASNQVNRNDLENSGVAVAANTGSLGSGFSLRFYRDPTFLLPARGRRHFVGSEIFVSVDWALPREQNLLQFYISECMAEVEGARIGIIKDNCYASKLDAAMRQSDWIVSKSSKFSYKSFAVGGSKKLKQKMTMACKIKICTTNNLTACRNELNETDEKCPKYDGSYVFTAHGAPK